MIHCDHKGAAMAEHLRTIADMIEAGELHGAAVSGVYPAESGNAQIAGFWTGPEEMGYFALVAATASMALRVNMGFTSGKDPVNFFPLEHIAHHHTKDNP